MDREVGLKRCRAWVISARDGHHEVLDGPNQILEDSVPALALSILGLTRPQSWTLDGLCVSLKL